MVRFSNSLAYSILIILIPIMVLSSPLSSGGNQPVAFGNGAASDGTDSAIPTDGSLRQHPADLHTSSGEPPAVEIEPASLEEQVFSGGSLERHIRISNQGESDVHYRVSVDVVDEPGARDANGRAIRSLAVAEGPQRDALGDSIAFFESPLSAVTGMTFDGTNVWGCSYTAGRIAAMDLDGNVVCNVAIHRNPVAMTYDGEKLWVGQWDGRTVYTYNLQGENIANFNLNFAGMEGMTYDGNGHVLINSNVDNLIHVINVDDLQEERTIEFREAMNNSGIWGIAWVPSHNNGQLWGTDGDRLYQVAVDENWNTSPVQDFEWNADGPYVGPTHDGTNLWHAAWNSNIWSVVDDGIVEHRWVEVEPKSGDIEANGSTDVTVELNATGLIAGEYTADIHFLSNDPDNPDVTAAVTLVVEGAPNLALSWSREVGFPDLIDFNLIYPDLFSGSPFSTEFTIMNNGTDVLNVSSITANHESFSFTPDHVVIEPRNSENVMVRFNAAEGASEDIDAAMTIASNDPDEAELTIALHAFVQNPPEMELNPSSLDEELFSGASVERIITVTNTGDADLRFTVEKEIISEPDNRDANARSVRSLDKSAGPKRDDAGDQIAQFQSPITTVGGMAFDGTNMWGCSYGQGRLASMDLEGNVGVNVAIHANPLGMTFDGDLLWIASYPANVMRTYDLQGQLVETFNLNINSITGMGSDRQGLVFMNCGNDGNIHVINSEDHQEVANFAFRNGMGGANIWGIDWVPEHPDGQLWGTSGNVLYQAHVDAEWNVEAVQDFNWNADQPYVGPAHDGENMWHGMWRDQNWFVFDDGVAESNWLTVDPMLGELEGGEQMDITIGLDAFGLLAGDYEADVHFLTNIPEDPDATLSILLHVEGAPDISVAWPEAVGFPDVLDFNVEHLDLFCGSEYEQTFVIRNDGTDELVMEEITADHEWFSFDPAAPVIAPRESATVTIRFNAPANDPRGIDAVVTLPSNDPDEQAIEFNVHAESFLPPIMELNPASIEDALFSGASSEWSIEVANTGDAQLRFKIEKEIISEPEGRDANARKVRSLDASIGPKRDEAGDQLAQFQSPITNVSGMAFDGTNMWACSYGQGRLASMDLEGNQIANIQIHANAMGMTFDGELLWIGQYNTNTVRTYDTQGQLVETFNLAFNQMYGMGSDQNGRVFINSGADSRIHVINSENHEQIASFVYRNAAGNADIWGIEWVPSHRDGQLWCNATGRVYQVAVDGDWNVQAVQNFAWNSDGPYVGPAHDGANLWHGMWNTQDWFVFDDGVEEVNWLIVDPDEGRINAGDRMNVAVTLDAFGLIAGDYQASLHFISNDPDNADGVVDVLLHVEGASDIGARWANEEGFPNVIDFNSNRVDLFCGSSYSQTISILNEGTSELDVQEIWFESEYFTANLDQFVTNPRRSQDLILTFNAPDEPIDENTSIHLRTNDPDEGEFQIPIHARAWLPPVLDWDPASIEEDLRSAEVVERNVNLSNSGGSPLRWTTVLNVIQEPHRDATARSIRRLVENLGPRRDDPIAQYDSPISSVTGMAFDGDLMWGISYSQTRLVALDLQGNVVHNYELGFSPVGLGWDGEGLWIGVWSTQAIRRYNRDGQQIETFNLPFSPVNGMCGDGSGRMLCNSSSDNRIHVINAETHQEETSFSFREAMGNSDIWGIEWVEEHRDGKLWGNATGRLYQVSIGENWNVEAVKDMPWNTDQPYGGPAHDGENMWHGMWGTTTWYVYDDEVDESNWIEWAPTSGELMDGSDIDLAITMAAAGMLGGDYEADLHILSNDPANPDAVISVILHVEDIGPVIAFDPPELDFGEIEPGTTRVLPIEVTNNGSSTLNISAVDFEGAGFRSNFRQAIQLRPLARASFNVTFAPALGMLYEGIMIVRSDDRENSDAEVRVIGNGTNRPPVLSRPIPDIVVNEDAGGMVVANLTLVFRDSARDSLFFSVAAPDPLRFSIDPNGIMIMHPIANYTVHNQLVVASVVDLGGNALSDSFLVTVRPVNDAPGAFHLIAPGDQARIGAGEYNVNFVWGTAENVDQDTITYKMSVRVTNEQLDTTLLYQDLAATQKLIHLDSLFWSLGIYTEGPELRVPLSWRVEASDGRLVTQSAETRELFVAAPLGVGGGLPETVTDFSFGNAYPNPFNSQTRISFDLPHAAAVKITVWDIQGKQRSVLVDGVVDAGKHAVNWNGGDAAAGVYLLQIEAPGFREVRKVTLVR